MPMRIAALCLAVASVTTQGPGARLAAQASAPRGEPDACALVTSADVEKVTGRPARKAPSHVSDTKKIHSYCGYRDARVRVTLVSKASTAQQHVSQELIVGGFEQTKHRVAELGDSAAIYFTPEGRRPAAFLVAHAGTRTLTIGIKLDEAERPDAGRPLAVGLAKIALAKLD